MATLLAATLLVLGGCTLINKLDSVQCSTNSDCSSRGGEFVQSICGADGVCVSLKLEQGGAGGTAGNGGAAGDAGVAGVAGAAGDAGSGGGGQCKTNQDCINLLGGQVLCKAGACIPLTTKECPKTLGNITEDPEQIFGVMTPQLTTKAAEFGSSYVTALSTGFKEYRNQAQGSILGFKAPFFILCDELGNPEAAAEHLVNTVGVRTIFGPAWSSATQKVLPIALKSKTILMLPSNDDPLLNQTDSKGQVWSCKPNRSKIEKYWASTLTELQKILKKQTPPVDSLSAGLIVAGDSSSQALASRIAQKTSEMIGEKYFRLDYDDFRQKQVPYQSVASNIINHPSGVVPNLIIVISSGDGARNLAPDIENSWDETKGPRPNYLFVGDREGIDYFFGVANPANKADSRTFNLDSLRDNTVQQANSVFRAAYKSDGGLTPQPDAETFYDCFWMNQYSYFYLTTTKKMSLDSIDSASFATGMAKLQTGAPGVVGEGGVSNVLDLLKVDNSVDLTGASTTLNFDTTQGAPIAKGGLNCGKDLKLVASGIEFDPDTGNATVPATLACP